ncbi:unnamed protein product [Lactuca virosa]|uniref:3-oxoacyl-[acyl-carrier-protein] reductase n=1 Tax=Lactuca virosa TaxID=75947 RepID=A0AAU9MCX8_9ASTR|nr:unnamed protein product [Lactuca virosa]
MYRILQQHPPSSSTTSLLPPTTTLTLSTTTAFIEDPSMIDRLNNAVVASFVPLEVLYMWIGLSFNDRPPTVMAPLFPGCDYEHIIVKEAVDSVGPIDVLVCNQGVFVAQELENQEMKEIRDMIEINLIGTFNLVKAALPAMKSRTDRKPVSIAFMSSQAGQVGIYGYTSYSASKFGLRGLAEALQQEVIADNIHVSVIFPPDTDTPGLAEENKRKPRLTSIIAASSGAMKADEVAQKAWSGIKSGSFFVPCNLEGFMLSVATAGLSPQRSYLMAFVEVISAGLMRVAGLCFQWSWYVIHM